MTGELPDEEIPEDAEVAVRLAKEPPNPPLDLAQVCMCVPAYLSDLSVCLPACLPVSQPASHSVYLSVCRSCRFVCSQLCLLVMAGLLV